MKLIVGLGNPGSKYKFNKHNVGFLVIDKLCEKWQIDNLNKEKFNGAFTIVDDVVVAKPMTYMNKSGEFIRDIVKYFKIQTSDILVIHDEINMEIGKASIKIGGSAAGHNGLSSIIDELQTKDFKKIRIGVGRDTTKELKDDVLSNFTKEQMPIIEIICTKAAEAAASFAFNDINVVMERFNVNRRKGS
ncbi:aminoacyl-tRNA hydrolase [Mycoplasmopsis hyopharyngis]|uniref:aminoacyl-tRNA hydrolase n=1 Tax=Mycoplasmopsis hyopharyngis TaxID=29558 RepID=UPI00387382E3